jgi:hypothetical protein
VRRVPASSRRGTYIGFPSGIALTPLEAGTPTQPAPPQGPGNGLAPFVLVAVVPKSGMLKVATSNMPEPPAVDTFVGVTVRLVLAVPTVAPGPLAAPRTPAATEILNALGEITTKFIGSVLQLG